jgi:hypothetical protein
VPLLFLRINYARLRKEKILRLRLRLKLPLHVLKQQLSSSLLRKEIPQCSTIIFDNREIVALDVTNKGNTYVYPKLNYQFGKDDIHGRD